MLDRFAQVAELAKQMENVIKEMGLDFLIRVDIKDFAARWEDVYCYEESSNWEASWC